MSYLLLLGDLVGEVLEEINEVQEVPRGEEPEGLDVESVCGSSCSVVNVGHGPA